MHNIMLITLLSSSLFCFFFVFYFVEITLLSSVSFVLQRRGHSGQGEALIGVESENISYKM